MAKSARWDQQSGVKGKRKHEALSKGLIGRLSAVLISGRKIIMESFNNDGVDGYCVVNSAFWSIQLC